eukprot:552771_1
MILHYNNGKPAKFDEIITYYANCMLVHMIWVLFILSCVLLMVQDLCFYEQTLNLLPNTCNLQMQHINGDLQIKNRNIVHIELYDVLLIWFIPNITFAFITFIIFKQIFRVAKIISYPCTRNNTSCNNTMLTQLPLKEINTKHKIYAHNNIFSSPQTVQKCVLGFYYINVMYQINHCCIITLQ